MLTSLINIKRQQNRQWIYEILVYGLEVYFGIIYRSEKMMKGSNLDVSKEVDLLKETKKGKSMR